jgi:hypothetical protein
MKKYFLNAKEFIDEHRKEFTTAMVVVGSVAVIITGLALYSYNQPKVPAIIYEPAKACELFTLDDAKSFLGDKTINGVNTNPVQNGAITISECSYSDGKVDTENAVVIALKVRSGINDAGIELNKAQFISGTPTEGVEPISDVGDRAYFNQFTGKLNVLKESTWLLISYGSAQNPSANSLEDSLKIADKVLNP